MIYGGYFDPDNTLNRIKELESIMNEPGFWYSKKKSEEVIKEMNSLKTKYENTSNIKKRIEDNLTMIDSLKTDMDSELYALIKEESEDIKNELDDIETLELLNGKYDNCDAILEIHPGAGGTESCDWAAMLYRMYTRWCEKHGFKYEVLNYEDGEEAGIKSLSMMIHGTYVYGYLKSEKGVHRLIRISPFDSNSRRHTSFAAVLVTPVYDTSDIDITINPDDIRVDVYRSSGKGGQGVNTTDSAVRITHIPTKIVVTCQNERSQIQNKERALEVLKNKLYELEVEKKEEELNKIKGINTDINFGSQIRTYTMCPYTLVKDHRTNTEVTDVNRVLDGDIDKFINDNLKRG
jgi:peptide chain release factor 2